MSLTLYRIREGLNGSRSFGLSMALVGVIILMMTPTNARAQNVLESGFERDVNRYRWTSGIRLDLRVGDWKLRASNQFRSDAFLLFDDRLSFRDENRFNFAASRPLGKTATRFVIFGRADWFSLSRVFLQDTWVGVRWQGKHPWWIEPVVGFAVDARPGFGVDPSNIPVRTDVGPGIGLRFGIPMMDAGGYLIEATGEAHIENTSPRTRQLFRTRATSLRTYERTTIRTRISGSSVRRDAYQAASFLNRDYVASRKSETVESTRSDTLTFGLDIDSQLAAPIWITASIDLSTNSRSVQTFRAPLDALFFDSNFNRRTVEVSLATRYEQGSTRLRLAVVAGAEVERRRLDNADDLPAAQAAQKLNLLRQADNERGYVSLQGAVNFSLTPWWDLQFDGSANILRHDTPEVNPDDRDELLYNSRVGSRFHIRDGLDFSLQLYGSWFHTVYIKSARSAENTVQRSLRFRPSVQWQPDMKTRIRLTSEVRATYTVDDFILPGRRPTDQSARELRFEFEGERKMSHGIRVLLSGTYSDLQLGRFLDNVFAEIPFDTLRTYSVWARVQTAGSVQAELGLRAFIRTDFDRSASVRYQSSATGLEESITRSGRTRIDQIGPTTSIVWSIKPGAFLRIEGWSVLQRVSNRLYGELPEGMEAEIRRAASKGRRSIIPNLAVTMRWTW